MYSCISTEHVTVVKTLFVIALSIYVLKYQPNFWYLETFRFLFRKSIIYEPWYKYVAILIQIQTNWLYSKCMSVRKLKTKEC